MEACIARSRAKADCPHATLAERGLSRVSRVSAAAPRMESEASSAAFCDPVGENVPAKAATFRLNGSTRYGISDVLLVTRTKLGAQQRGRSRDPTRARRNQTRVPSLAATTGICSRAAGIPRKRAFTSGNSEQCCRMATDLSCTAQLCPRAREPGGNTGRANQPGEAKSPGSLRAEASSGIGMTSTSTFSFCLPEPKMTPPIGATSV